MPSHGFTVHANATLREQLVMNDGRAQETLGTLVAATAKTGNIFRQGDGDAMRGVIIRSLTAAEIKALGPNVSLPRGLLLPAPLTAADIQDFAEQQCDVVKLRKLPNGTKYEARPADFRADLAHRFLRSRLLALRPLRGVSYTPILRSNGTILDTPGYDAATQLWIVDDVPEPDLSDTPSRAGADAALELLSSLLTGHPFEHERDRVAALAMLMVPPLRASMERAPLLVADANYPRTGKDYLLGTAALIGTGHRPTVYTLNEAREEQQKRIGAALLLGAPVVSLNNVNGRLDSDELAAYLTEGGCITRAYATVGGAKYAPNGNVIATSGNNIMLAGDLPERGLASRQDARMEQPGDRKFQTSPHDEVRADRSKYLGAIFTIARWPILGRDYQAPDMAGSGGFDDFDRLIRGPLLVLTGIDPLERSRGEMQTARQHRPDRDLVDALTSLMPTDIPFCTKDVQAQLQKRHVLADEPDPWAVLRHKDLPYRLRRARGRRGATMQFISTERPPNGADVAWYRLLPLVAPDAAELCGLRDPSDPLTGRSKKSGTGNFTSSRGEVRKNPKSAEPDDTLTTPHGAAMGDPGIDL